MGAPTRRRQRFAEVSRREQGRGQAQTEREVGALCDAQGCIALCRPEGGARKACCCCSFLSTGLAAGFAFGRFGWCEGGAAPAWSVMSITDAEGRRGHHSSMRWWS